ncbi:hypothetical protein CLV30_11939 [Haloactinopolyspora alba]|uniref:Sodium:proton antiporter n=1 Tax=Haloactinopolyspora alba TaxID=648780 RepID=A0A2P8DN66_9ACTN|nr:DUF6328 family protein [Haloactinopolyspora alba]PSK98657.1 hypothetical protein CLV30_11939 [Haloactinopolyspora alba]
MSTAHYERDEDQAHRFDRHWNELLQELRLAQTGTQILFAFLLAIAFTRPFQEADTFTHSVFAATLVLAAMATGLLIAPVAFHRMVFQRRMRDRMIPAAARMAAGGLLLLMLAICGGLLLALDVVMNRGLAIGVSAAVLCWFVAFWYVIPAIVRRAG